MTRFKKHLGEGKEIEIEGEKYTIKPLTTDEMPLFLQLMKITNKEGDLDIAKIDAQTSQSLVVMLNKTLQKSFPTDWKEDEEEVKQFGMKYMTVLLNAIIEVNVPNAGEKETKIEELKQRLAPQ